MNIPSPLRRRTLAALATALLAACSPSSPKFDASDITGASFGRDFSLKDPKGAVRTLADFRGKAVVLFFGYTQCPDVCPTTLSTLAQAMKLLGADADRVQVLFVTIDPARDTPALLAQYVPAFDPRFLGLWGDAEATARTAKEFKILYEKVARRDARQLHDGSFGGDLRLRPAGAPAPVRRVRAGARGLCTRPAHAAPGLDVTGAVLRRPVVRPPAFHRRSPAATGRFRATRCG